MKALVVLALLGLAAAKPQFLLPYNVPLVTAKAADDTAKPIVNAYTAAYPYASNLHTYPLLYNQFPQFYNFPNAYPFAINPLMISAKPAEAAEPAEESSRKKRSADPQLLYTAGSNQAIWSHSLGMLPTTSAGIIPSTYTLPTTTGVIPSVYTIPTSNVAATGFIPTTPTTYAINNNPYSYFPYTNPFWRSPIAAKKEETAVESARKKRSADPQLIYNTAGTTGFYYPAVNTQTRPLTYAYNLPTTYTYPTAFPHTFSNAVVYGK